MSVKWLIAASHPLDSVFKVSAYHLTTGLAKREHNEVLYLCAPISPFHRARPSQTTDLKTREALWRNGPTRHEDRLWEYCPRTTLPYVNRPFLRSRWVADRWLQWTKPPLLDTLREIGFDSPDVLMVINLQYAGLFELLESRLSIYRNIDEIRGMAHVPPSMAEIEREAARQADIVIPVSVVQEEKLWQCNARRVVRLPHGVDLSMFEGPAPDEPREFKFIPPPRVIFVGALTQWVDHRLIVKVAQLLPRISFVMIGPADPPFPDCLTEPNIHYLGPRPYEDVPVFLRNCHVGMIPFGRSAIVESAHPLKLLTYLAAGLPTVCSPWKELEAMGLPVRIGPNPREFARQIDRLLAEAKEPDLAEQRRRQLTESVRDCDWKSIVDRLEAIVAEVGQFDPTELPVSPDTWTTKETGGE